jgi:hypothetical protein
VVVRGKVRISNQSEGTLYIEDGTVLADTEFWR